MPEDYADLPSVAQWQKDSWILRGSRTGDGLVLRLDALVGQYHATENKPLQLYTIADMWFTADLWLRLCDKPSNPPTEMSAAIDKGRRPSVYKLYKVVVAKMSELSGVPVNLLPMWLEASYGKQMVAHGYEVDGNQKEKVYLKPEQVEAAKLIWKGGKLYRKNGAAEVLFNSSDYQNPPTIPAGYSGYVLGWARDFYASKHANNQLYHSSYFGGRRLLCAGTIKVLAGVVTEITTDSGHYQPSQGHMVSAVQALALYGVDLDQLQVVVFGVQGKRSGTKFLADWATGVAALGTRTNDLNQAQRTNSEGTDRIAQQHAGAFGWDADKALLQKLLESSPAKYYMANYATYRRNCASCKNRPSECEKCKDTRVSGIACGLAKGQIGTALPEQNTALKALKEITAKLTAMRTSTVFPRVKAP